MGVGAPVPRAAVRPPAGGAAMPSGSSVATYEDPYLWWWRVAKVVVAVAALVGGFLIYKRVTRPDVYAVSSPYRTNTGVTIELPAGGGWRTDRRLRMKQRNGPAWMRADVVFHGAKVATADRFVLTMRVHVPGGFPYQVDSEELRAGLERQLKQAVASAGSAVEELRCVVDGVVRTESSVACFGRVNYLGLALPAGVYLWQAGTDDVIGVAYATTDDTLTPLMDMARTAR